MNFQSNGASKEALFSELIISIDSDIMLKFFPFFQFSSLSCLTFKSKSV